MNSDEPHKAHLLPLIRHLSTRVTPALLRLPVSANIVTTASLLTGLSACWYFAQGTWIDSLIGAGLFVICYILDNCDGDVARARNQCSSFGREYDTFVDWLVHSAFFACLGWGVTAQTGEAYWFWLGMFGALGGTINYMIAVVMTLRGTGAAGDIDPGMADTPESVLDWAVFALRELSRADFCVIVVGLAVFDVTWILLPTAAVGAHAYWVAAFYKRARRFHI
ncbi:MAG: CDP-alcohol phosphatidyltransferase family protein [Rhodospirillales bacterium]|nr:CDP-alcohol phosphatidyltransferase family protein [Rhodospirillales bacterium]MBO6785884.1 CDP-alcohol phosphatidyltransferase family protein [Rhodospirillales bacterium]